MYAPGMAQGVRHGGAAAEALMSEEAKRDLEAQMDIETMVRSFDAQLPSDKEGGSSFFRTMLTLALISGAVAMAAAWVRAGSVRTLAGPTLDGKAL